VNIRVNPVVQRLISVRARAMQRHGFQTISVYLMDGGAEASQNGIGVGHAGTLVMNWDMSVARKGGLGNAR
jgi:hypothetical protein